MPRHSTGPASISRNAARRACSAPASQHACTQSARRGWAQRALITCLAMGLALQPLGMSGAAAQNSPLPDLGDESQALLTPVQEHKMGESVVRQIRGAGAYLEDPEVNDYLNQLGQRLVAAIPEGRMD